MSRVTAFRLLLAALWLVPLALALIDLAIYLATPHTTAIAPGPRVTQLRLVLDQVATWLGWVALLTGLFATVGLCWFRSWAIDVFVVGVATYLGYVGLCDYFDYRLLPQVALLVHGMGLGAVAAWLAVARSTLPFVVRG
jgi:hypothetical protein